MVKYHAKFLRTVSSIPSTPPSPSPLPLHQVSMSGWNSSKDFLLIIIGSFFFSSLSLFEREEGKVKNRWEGGGGLSLLNCDGCWLGEEKIGGGQKKKEGLKRTGGGGGGGGGGR